MKKLLSIVFLTLVVLIPQGALASPNSDWQDCINVCRSRVKQCRALCESRECHDHCLVYGKICEVDCDDKLLKCDSEDGDYVHCTTVCKLGYIDCMEGNKDSRNRLQLCLLRLSNCTSECGRVAFDIAQ